MDEIFEFIDERQKEWCVHCGTPLAETKPTRDHVPTKTLLLPPFPGNLPIVMVCEGCNKGFGKDEQYLVAFLSSVLAGSTEPALQPNPNAARILTHNHMLRAAIEKTKRQEADSEGKTQLYWAPDTSRIASVVVKNARGHAFFEYGEPMLEKPSSVSVLPLPLMSHAQCAAFDDIPSAGVFPEIGSRMMTRVMTGQDMDGSWVVVQEGVYRFAVTQFDGLLVRSVMSEYLATEVHWSN